ncbi:hypothetical protein DN404_18650 [Bacillus sp. TE8-1]|nr:hypothetical protein DN404_18650 [Bacillus sp. TE8-1]
MWRILRSFFRFLSKSCTSPSKLNFETYVRVLCERFCPILQNISKYSEFNNYNSTFFKNYYIRFNTFPYTIVEKIIVPLQKKEFSDIIK